MFWVKKYIRGSDLLIAFCDEDIMDKEFKEGKFKLKIGAFYKGKIMNKEEVLEILKEATIINASGVKAMKVLEELGFNTKNSIKVQGIPHLQIVHYFMR